MALVDQSRPQMGMIGKCSHGLNHRDWHDELERIGFGLAGDERPFHGPRVTIDQYATTPGTRVHAKNVGRVITFHRRGTVAHARVTSFFLDSCDHSPCC